MPKSLNEPKSYVLLVHGFKTSSILTASIRRTNYACKAESAQWALGVKSDFRQMPQWLIDDGFVPFIAYYDSNPNTTPSNETNAKCLRRQLIQVARQSPTGKVIIIAHSMGGLVIRAYLDGPAYKADVEAHGGELVECAFFLGTPNQAMAHHWLLVLNLNCARNPRQRGAYEFSSKKFMAEFNQRFKHTNTNIPYYLIGGIQSSGAIGMLSNTYIAMVWGANDGICPADSATTLEGAFQTAVVEESHMGTVGQPSYFDPRPGNRYSHAYADCIRPVLVDGDPLGCKTNVTPRRTIPWWMYPVTLVAYCLFYFFSVFRYLRHQVVDYFEKQSPVQEGT